MAVLSSPHASGRIDWKDIRDRVDPSHVAIALLGPAPGRRGTRPPPLVALPVPRGWQSVILRGARQAMVALLRVRRAWRRAEAGHEVERGGIPRGGQDPCRPGRHGNRIESKSGRKSPPPYTCEVSDLRPGLGTEPRGRPVRQQSRQGIPARARAIVRHAPGRLLGALGRGPRTPLAARGSGRPSALSQLNCRVN